MKLLLFIEDKTNSSKALNTRLKKEGYVVDSILDSEIGLEMALLGSYDLIVLDSFLPMINGLNFIKELRAHHIAAPILVLHTNNDIKFMIDCLDAGADDYLVKPFSLEVFLARLRALSRRIDKDYIDNELIVAGLVLNTLKCRVAKGNNVIKLSVKETLLLETLMRNYGNVVTKERIFERLWGANSVIEFANVDLYICYLRKKIGASTIKTVRNIGYYLEQTADQ
ncbi:response regulator transcription factor [Desulfosporosinus hippei]|uniref:Stage 0 sporulation protein A homolog n=1 Tax=Desulfosporosinus hippei DSM 8344 TaxID=1121419 RepID=A0A1G8JAC9_9FIRM|nr:response regulator transcription factor [Desulfosporosinus hippei]SDI28041.1 DNA-binding response regulator, OmpR family, contains REC and winged-helix (wHTH) domain [Desulfosporosinus hippei DSM 8344]